MGKQAISSKRLQINKAQASTVIFLAVASFILVFSLVASRALLDQRSYQARVIKEKRKALDQLKTNNKAATQLVDSYKAFLAAPENIIGGNPTGSGDRDGDNGRIVLDALPSKYDYPALIASLDKVLTNKNYKIDSISGTDDEINQQAQATGLNQSVEIPFQVSVSGNFESIQGFINVLERSIRPIKFDKLNFSGDDNNLTVNATAKSYYHPEKTIKITSKVVK